MKATYPYKQNSQPNSLEFSWNVKAGKDYVPELPKGWKVLGVLTRFGGSKSAFVISDTGVYYQANGTVYKELDQSMIQSIIKLREKGFSTKMINLNELHRARMRQKGQK